MDEQRFDAIARAFALGATRRTLLRGLIAGGVGGALLRRRGGAALAQDCGAFIDQACQADGDCQLAGIVPQCPSNVCCGGVCVDTLSDPTSCGSCGIGCAEGEVCQDGECASVCPAGQRLCGNDCVDVSSDPANCGACGAGCGDLTCCAGQCIDTTADPANCGGCGVACGPDTSCDAGLCVSVCPAGTTLCGETCVDLTSDPANCGQCGTTCGAEDVCAAGVCEPICPSGFTPCDGICTDVSSDPVNCGACGEVCAGQTCAAGVCADLPCRVEQQNDDLVYRYAVDAPADDLSLEMVRTVQVDEAGADAVIVSDTTVNRAGDLVLRLIHRQRADDSWSVTLRYGAVFGGIGEAVFRARGDGLVRGRVDGRRLEPFRVGADPASIEFDDGRPAPDSAVDPALADALGRLFGQAQQGIDACAPAVARAGSRVGFLAQASSGYPAPRPLSSTQLVAQAGEDYCDPGHVTYPPLGSTDCVLCRGGCMAAGASCGVGVALGCSAGCAAALLGYGICLGICLTAGLIGCASGEYYCLNTTCRKPPAPCCPTGCSKGCCLGDEVCLDAGTGLCCGGEFTKPCNGTCCCRREDTCMADGTCCPRGNKICEGTCCNVGETCFEGGCCAKVCDQVTPRVCCGQFDACTECGCCPPGTTCSRTRDDRKICCPTDRLCGDVCCPQGEVCQDARTGTCFGSTACPPGQVACPGGVCCPTVRAQGGGTIFTCCGNVCCSSDAPYCCSPGDDTTVAVCRAVGCIR